MGLKLYEETSVQAIANAIRAKNGSSDTYTISEMSTAIGNIPSGGGGGNTKVVTDDLVLVSQNGSTATWYEDGSVDFTWAGNTSIGFNYNGTVPIKDAKRVLIHIDELGESYQHSQSTSQRNWNFAVGLTNVALQSYIDLTNIDNQGKLVTDVEVDVNDNYGKTDLNYVIDLSSYQNQDLYLFILAPGITVKGLKVTLVYDNDYYIGEYEYHWSNDSKICVREGIGDIKWFFVGLIKTSSDMDIPEELLDYVPKFAMDGNALGSKAWISPTAEWDNDYIGFVYPGTSDVKIRSWHGSYLGSGTYYSVVNILDSTATQDNPYVDPTDVNAKAMKVGTKIITTDGVYSAEDDGYTGYSEVTVANVSPGSQISYTDICACYHENSIAALLGKRSMISEWSLGASIGCSWNGTVDLVASGYSKMYYRAYIGAISYDASAGQNIRPIVIGVTPTQYQTGQYVDPSAVASVYTDYDMYLSADYKDVTVAGVIDFSSETDPQYLLIIATGHCFEMLDMWFE